MKVSDERLNQLIEYQNKWCAECELDDTEHIPREGLWDTHAALVELANYRRTFAMIEEILRSNYDMTFIVLDIVNQKFEAVQYQLDDGRAGEARADTQFAALSALADSIIREELERKDSTP